LTFKFYRRANVKYPKKDANANGRERERERERERRFARLFFRRRFWTLPPGFSIN